MKTNRNSPPLGVIITMPEQFFKSRNMDYEVFNRFFDRELSKDDGVWNYAMKNLPVLPVIYVYMVYDRKIQNRTNLVELQRGVTKEYCDATDGVIRIFPQENWLVLSGPVTWAPQEYPMQGFQGLRYTQKIF